MNARALVDAGWPGEEGVAWEHHKNRLHVALHTLRELGLRELLVHREDGYVLAAHIAIAGAE